MSCKLAWVAQWPLQLSFQISKDGDWHFWSTTHQPGVYARWWTLIETPDAFVIPLCWCLQHQQWMMECMMEFFHTIFKITKTFSKEPQTTMMTIFSSIRPKGEKPSSTNIYLIGKWKTWLNEISFNFAFFHVYLSINWLLCHSYTTLILAY